MLVPINRTFAPISAFPLLASMTRPFNVICPNEVLTKANMNNVVSTAILFIIMVFLKFIIVFLAPGTRYYLYLSWQVS